MKDRHAPNQRELNRADDANRAIAKYLGINNKTLGIQAKVVPEVFLGDQSHLADITQPPSAHKINERLAMGLGVEPENLGITSYIPLHETTSNTTVLDLAQILDEVKAELPTAIALNNIIAASLAPEPHVVLGTDKNPLAKRPEPQQGEVVWNKWGEWKLK